HDNTTGISANGDVFVTLNVLYNDSTGISIVGYIYEASANIVHDNGIGIYAFNSEGLHTTSSGGLIYGNTVYHNSQIGIEAELSLQVTANDVYSNGTGIALDYNSTGLVSDNLVYANTTV